MPKKKNDVKIPKAPQPSRSGVRASTQLQEEEEEATSLVDIVGMIKT